MAPARAAGLCPPGARAIRSPPRPPSLPARRSRAAIGLAVLGAALLACPGLAAAQPRPEGQFGGYRSGGAHGGEDGAGRRGGPQRGRWREGEWRHTWHDGRFGWWWWLDNDWYWYPEPVYPYPEAAPPPDLPPPAPLPPPPHYWYRCDARGGFYPYVTNCPGGWRAVPAVPPGAPQP